MTRSRLEVLAILLVGWLVFLIYAYPGYMSFDSVVQLREARTGVFTDWHPPAMAALWRITDHIISGPFGMLVLQTTAFLAGCYLVIARYVKPRYAAIFTVLLFWFPPMSSTMAVIWKDSQMTGYLLLGMALLLSERARNRNLGLGLLLVASMMRHNGFTFTLPMIVILWQWPRLAGWKCYAASLGLWLAITVVAFATNAALAKVKTHPWHSSVALHDIVGTLRYANLDDAEIKRELGDVPLRATDHLHDRIRTVYIPAAGVFTIGPLIAQPTNEQERDAVSAAWKRIVRAHPFYYLKHRYKVFKCVLGLAGTPMPVWVGYDGIGADLYDDQPSATQAAMRDWMLQTVANSWVMRPYLYLLAIIGMLYWVAKSRDRFLIALTATAFISEAALYFVSPTPDFRYSIWVVPTSFILLIALVVTRSQRAR